MFFILFIIAATVITIIVFLVYSNKRNTFEHHGSSSVYGNPVQSSEKLGEFGENSVKSIIGETVEDEKYVINNLIIKNNESTSQIDHIVINPRGIFVIETKNYSGKIYGTPNQREWTQILAHGNVRNKIYNPIKQNATHVYNVRKILGFQPIRSLIVFTQNNTEHVDANDVIPISALRKTLNCGQPVLTAEQMKTAYNALLSKKISVTNNEHVKNVKEQQFKLACGYCPRCGSKLVVRNGKYGEFWGCSNYPKCKFIKNFSR